MNERCRVLLVLPPLTQLNTPYASMPMLKAFLSAAGYDVTQCDLGIELVDRIYTRGFLSKAFPAGHPDGRRYAETVEPVMRFLRGEDSTLAMRIANGSMLPEGKRFRQAEDLEWAFGTSGYEDRARHLATLYVEDIADWLRENVDPHFELIRYAEHLSCYAAEFDGIEEALRKPPSPITELMFQLLERHIADSSPRLVGFSIPFPGCLVPALQCGEYLKKYHPEVVTVFGGGFPNTEWRQLREARLFDYTDYVTLDDGELPTLRLLRHLEGRLSRQQLLRTYCRIDGKVVYINDTASSMPVQVRNDDLPAPDFSDLPLDRYLSLSEMANPMHRLWTNGRWNKLMMAHGCYWAKCAFCDTTLDYIGRYDAPRATTVVDRMQRVAEQTGTSGFHFVDEALPPQLLRQVGEEILRRGLHVSFWGNIRFEKAYDATLCDLLAEAGCIAVSGGLEVASDRLLQLIGKGVSVQQTVDAARHFRDAGIMVHTYLMYGFPTETLQETIDALENVRRMFEEGIVQSAFWHRYAMTVHSPSGRNPERYGARRVDSEPGAFCNNEIPFEAPFEYDLDAAGDALRRATYNYMNGLGLDLPVRQWFKRLLPYDKKRKRR